jgi:hypothetical protein
LIATRFLGYKKHNHHFHSQPIAMKPNDPIICRKCKFYFITWEPHQPHGCKAMNFKSRRPPHLVVRQTSGAECLHYVPKDDLDNDDGIR